MSQENDPKPEATPFFSFARIVSAFLFSCIFPVKWHGREKLQALGPSTIIVANHKSILDPLVIGSVGRPYEVRFLGKTELDKTPIVGSLTRKLHMIPVNRHESDLAALRACGKVLKERHALGIFPEGTRCPDTLMEKLESGTSVLALRAKAPLLPVYFHTKLRFLRRTHVYVGDYIDYDDLQALGSDAQTAQQLTGRIRDVFFQMRDTARRETGK